MADKFRVGQKVRAKTSPQKGFKVLSKTAHLLGAIGTVIEQRWFANGALRYTVDFDGFIAYPPEEALDPLYDGDKASSWSECAWKPHLIDNKLPEMFKEKS